MTVSDLLEQLCNNSDNANMSDNAIKLLTACSKLVPTTGNKQCEHNLSTACEHRFVKTYLQTSVTNCAFSVFLSCAADSFRED